MQIPSNLTDPSVKSLSEKAGEVREIFLKHIDELTTKTPVKVMLGDGTVSNQESFDPAVVRRFYETVLRKLSNWTSDGVSATADKDLRRSFIKFEVKENNYVLSCHMSLQYHALLFYKLDHRVIDVQKELSELTDNIKQIKENTAPESNRMIEEKLKIKGYENMDQQKLFEVLFEHDELTQELIETLRSSEKKLNELTTKQDALFKELDNLLIEIYHTTPVLIDEMKMIAAEEGCLCVFNLEYENKGNKEGNINLGKIPNNVKEKLLKRMEEIIQVLNF